MKKEVIEALAAEYPQLYLNPDRDSQEMYRNVVLRGMEPETKDLSHFQGDDFDRLQMVDTPAGPVRAATLGCRHDYELAIRSFMAAKEGPLAPVPESQGASMITVFNWPRIHAHMAKFPASEQSEEFKRFTSVKANYIDMLVLLSRGPYSHVSAEAAGETEEEWLEHSDIIRRYHELTHVICRRLYPDRIDKIRDELVADAVGLFAAYGCFDLDKEMLFLGISDGKYIGGRLENYTDDPEGMAGAVCEELERIGLIVEAHSIHKTDIAQVQSPFELIPPLMEPLMEQG